MSGSKHNSNSRPWWKKTTVYHIYPRSFQDSNKDGIGDLEGILKRLDYIKELGFETLWLSPFFDSPQQDFGYDIVDYTGIAPEYGTMDTCERLIDEVHFRDMKIVFDLVLNHTSDRHPWFVESKYSRHNDKRDWYLWRDGRKPGGKRPPNNWLSVTGGSGWHYEHNTDQWYWATFLPFQPDLNYRNPEVKKTMLSMVRFWLEKGVDGFRLDIFDALFKDTEFRDNPFSFSLLPSSDGRKLFFQSRTMNLHHNDTFEFAKELRAVIDEYTDPPRYLVGEVGGDLGTLRRYCGEEEPDGLHSVFLFQTLSANLTSTAFKELISQVEQHFPDPFIPTWVFSNHDRIRRISFLGNDVQKAKLNTALQFTLRGIPFTYYGEEIGMEQMAIPFDKALDPIAARFMAYPAVVQKRIERVSLGAANRDGCRTPMQWNDSPNAGFCSEMAKPWLPVHPNYRRVNVNSGKVDINSLYHCYKRFLRVRNESPALHSGSLEVLEDKPLPNQVVCYRRTYRDDSIEEVILVYLNFSTKEQRCMLPDGSWRLLTSTEVEHPAVHFDTIQGMQLRLRSWEAVVLKGGDSGTESEERD